MNLHPFRVSAFLGLALMAVAVGPAGARPAGAQQEPTISLEPTSGPCDATIQITGQHFPPRAEIWLAVGEIGGRSKLGDLASAVTDSDGRLAAGVRLGFLGCAAASITGGSFLQIWLLAYVREDDPGGYERARILARAPYTFTTTESTLPVATLAVSPSRGPCDGRVELRGSLFEPGGQVSLGIARPYSEGIMGILATAQAGAGGDLALSLSLGSLGCEAAALAAAAAGADGPNELRICGAAYGRSACAAYTYTTTDPAPGPTPAALPLTGHGSDTGHTATRWLGIALAALGAGGVVAGASVLAIRGAKRNAADGGHDQL